MPSRPLADRRFPCLRLAAGGSRAEEGFTLIELILVVAIVGLLSAVAFPRYLEARAAARIGARVGEALAVARECQAYTFSNIGSPPQRNPPDPDVGGVVVDSCLPDANGGTIIASWGEARAGGVPCLSAVSTTSSTTATVQIQPNSTLSCRFD